MENISYRELARRVGDCVLANSLRANTEEECGYWECLGGSEYHDNCDEHDHYTAGCKECDDVADAGEPKEIYQEYVINSNGADYLIRNTHEIVLYNSDLDIHLWGITHFGTSWDGVYTSIKDN